MSYTIRLQRKPHSGDRYCNHDRIMIRYIESRPYLRHTGNHLEKKAVKTSIRISALGRKG